MEQKKKKIAVLLGLDARVFGGGEKYAIEFTNRIIDEFDITLFSYRSRMKHRLTTDEVGRLAKAPITYYNVLEIPLVVERVPVTTALFKLRDYDIIYNYDPSLATNVLLLLIAGLYGKRLIFGMHDPTPLKDAPLKQTMARRALLSVYKHLRNFVFFKIPEIRVINTEEENNLKRMGYKGKIYRIPDFVNVKPNSKDLSTNKKEFIALFVGRLSILHKGIDFLSEITDKTIAKNSDVKFKIVGSKDDGEYIVREMVKRHPKNVEWLGFVSEAQLRALYGSCSLFILTSRMESFGLSLAEAQAYGMPAISFSIKGASDIITEGYQGKLIKKFDTEKFADQITRYYALWKKGAIDRNLKARISENVLEKYSDDAVIPSFRKMFRGVGK